MANNQNIKTFCELTKEQQIQVLKEQQKSCKSEYLTLKYLRPIAVHSNESYFITENNELLSINDLMNKFAGI